MHSGTQAHPLKRSIPMVLLALAAALLLCSCPNFRDPVREYLEDWTNNAAIVRAEYPEAYPVDAEGVVSIPSGAMHSVNLILRNPQDYEVFASIARPAEDFWNNGTDYFLTPSADRRSILLSFDDDFLRARDLPDGDNDITSSIILGDNGTGRTFEPYTLRLRCNSAPPLIQGACVMLNGNTQVVCFALDLSDLVHEDITTIEVNRVSYPVTVNTGTMSFGGDAHFLVPGSVTLQPVAGTNISFNPPPGTHIVLFNTGKPNVDSENNSYAIRVIDDRGLFSAAAPSSKGKKLGLPRFLDAGGSDVIPGDNLPPGPDRINARLSIRAPAMAEDVPAGSGVAMEWELRDQDGNGLVSSGSGTDDIPLDIPNGAYRLSAIARKNGFVDSDTATILFTVSGCIFYVDSSAEYDPNAPGTLSRPMTYLSTAIGKCDTPDLRYTIYLTGVHSGGTNGGVLEITNKPYDIDFIRYGAQAVIDGGAWTRTVFISANSTEPFTISFTGITFRNGLVRSGLPGAGLYFRTTTGNLAIADCVIERNSSENSATDGGGIYFESTTGDLSVTNSDFIGNAAGMGGGIYFSSVTGTLSLDNQCDFTENSAYQSGGALYIYSEPGVTPATHRIRSSRFRGNYVNSQNNLLGGAIAFYGIDPQARLELTDCEIGGDLESEGNYLAEGYGGLGGGIYASGGELTLSNCLIQNNVAFRSGSNHAGSGGGICASYSTVEIYNSQITGNTANAVGYAYLAPQGYGGGICIEGGSLLIDDGSRISENRVFSGTIDDGGAYGHGGGIYASNADVWLLGGTALSDNNTNSTDTNSNYLLGGGIFFAGPTGRFLIMGGSSSISGNTAGTTGGGVYLLSGQMNLTDSTISGNAAESAAGSGEGVFLGTDSILSLSGNVDFTENDIRIAISNGAYVPITLLSELIPHRTIRLSAATFIPNSYVLINVVTLNYIYFSVLIEEYDWPLLDNGCLNQFNTP